MTDDTAPAPNKGVKKTDRLDAAPAAEPAVAFLSFDEFVQLEALSAVRAGGLETHLRATAGLASRPHAEWRSALNHYQAMA